MQARPFRSMSLLAFVAFLAAACADAPTSPSEIEAAKSTQSSDDGDVTIQCYIGEDDGYRCQPSEPEPPPEDHQPIDETPPPCDATYQDCGGGGGSGGSAPPGDDDGSTDGTTADGTGDCPTCVPQDTIQQRMYSQALNKINQSKCPELYNKAVSYTTTFKVWTEKRTITDEKGVTRVILGDWLQATLPKEQNPETAAFWTEHFTQSDFPVTVAHEAAHGIGLTDLNKEAEIYAQSCML